MSTAASAPPLSTSAALPKTTGRLLLPVFGLLGSAFGAGVGVAVGFTVGVAVGTAVGLAEGAAVGVAVGVAVGTAVGLAEGAAVGVAVGVAVGAAKTVNCVLASPAVEKTVSVCSPVANVFKNSDFNSTTVLPSETV